MWINYFDAAFVVGFKDSHRMATVTEELAKYGLDGVKFFAATKHVNGKEGLRLTMKALFARCLERGYKKVLVFEDDVRFIVDPSSTMDRCVEFLQANPWHLFYLGVNVHEAFPRFITPNILPVSWGYSTHAVAYNEIAMTQILNAIDNFNEPMDVLLHQFVQPAGECYCAYPILATQRNGWSYIENAVVDYDFIEHRFNMFVRHLI